MKKERRGEGRDERGRREKRREVKTGEEETRKEKTEIVTPVNQPSISARSDQLCSVRNVRFDCLRGGYPVVATQAWSWRGVREAFFVWF